MAAIHDIALTLNGSPIELINYVTNLDVYFTNILSWPEKVKAICNRVNVLRVNVSFGD